MELDRFRRGDAHELSFRLGAGLMLNHVVHAVESGEEGREIVPEATERSFQLTHARRADQLLAELIEERVRVYV